MAASRVSAWRAICRRWMLDGGQPEFAEQEGEPGGIGGRMGGHAASPALMVPSLS